MTVLYMHRNTPIPRLSEELSQLQPLLDQLLAKEVEDRFAGATEAAQAIEAAREQWLRRSA